MDKFGKYYNIQITCGNCNHSGTIRILKGNLISSEKCPICGCKELSTDNFSISPNPTKNSIPFIPGFPVYPPTNPSYPKWVDYGNIIPRENIPCMIDEFFKENPNGVCGMSCPCPKCTPWC